MLECAYPRVGEWTSSKTGAGSPPALATAPAVCFHVSLSQNEGHSPYFEFRRDTYRPRSPCRLRRLRPSSPVFARLARLARLHPSSPVFTRQHPSSPVFPRLPPSSPVFPRLTRLHLSSPIFAALTSRQDLELSTCCYTCMVMCLGIVASTGFDEHFTDQPDLRGPTTRLGGSPTWSLL